MEILCRIVDKGPGDDCSKRGDIISVQPDGWAWSNEELTNPDWRIIAVDSLLNTDRDSMLACRHDYPVGKFRKREWFLDFSKLPLPRRFTGARIAPIINMTRVGFIVALTQKPAMV